MFECQPSGWQFEACTGSLNVWISRMSRVVNTLVKLMSSCVSVGNVFVGRTGVTYIMTVWIRAMKQIAVLMNTAM